LRIVAGLSLSSLNPHVWKPDSPYHLPQLKAVMVSYADIHRIPRRRFRAMEHGIHQELGVPDGVKVYLDNGAFYFISREGETSRKEYDEFVENARPDWYPIPQDFIPTPQMGVEEQKRCFTRTMRMNRAYLHDGYTPVIHVSPFLEKYTRQIKSNAQLSAKKTVALGAIVPNLLRTPKALPYKDVLDSLQHTRQEFVDKELHVFGIGGTATVHLAALFGMDSVDSSGWRNRAARGIVQLPGRGDRIVANLGSWRGREPDEQEWKKLAECQCPACLQHGVEGLKASGMKGFCNRATHNLWTLLEESRWIDEQMAVGTYFECYKEHLENSTYRPLIDEVVALRLERQHL